MKRNLARLCFLMLIAGAALAQETPGPVLVNVNYFGFHIKVLCPVTPSDLPERKLQELVAKNSQEIAPCLAPIRNIYDQYQMKGYAQILFLSRFVKSLPLTSAPGPAVSFADAVVGKKPLNRDNQIALLYSFIAATGYTSMVYGADKGNILLLYVPQEIVGLNAGKHYYIWEPDTSFTEVPFSSGHILYRQKVVSIGKPVTFDTLPDIPWVSTVEGEEVSFRSPAGCPESWNFSLNRLPEYEKFIALWPREDSILAPLVYSMLNPFELDSIFQPRPAGMSEFKFGTCLLNWVQINAPYDEPHAADFRLSIKNITSGIDTEEDRSINRQYRNPLEMLFSIRRGVCGELSLTLAAILQAAGYSPDQILLANYDKATQESHLDLAVKMSGDESPPDAAFLLVNGARYYIMDPAVYIYGKNNQLLTRWGDTPYKGMKDAAIRPLNGN